MKWKTLAACKNKTKLFYPEETRGRPAAGGKDVWTEPRAICATCPVQRECLEAAVVDEEVYGMWGGLAPWERRRVRAKVLREMRER